jgi:hypothetical protein
VNDILTQNMRGMPETKTQRAKLRKFITIKYIIATPGAPACIADGAVTGGDIVDFAARHNNILTPNMQCEHQANRRTRRDQPVARPLHIHRATQTQNKRKNTSMP